MEDVFDFDFNVAKYEKYMFFFLENNHPHMLKYFFFEKKNHKKRVILLLKLMLEKCFSRLQIVLPALQNAVLRQRTNTTLTFALLIRSN